LTYLEFLWKRKLRVLEKMVKFSLAFSDKTREEEAIKEISLKTKYVLPRKINFALIFFTPHYRSTLLHYIVSITMQPENIVQICTPFLIYENKIVEKGVVCVCMELGDEKLGVDFVKTQQISKIEVSLRRLVKKLKRYTYLFSFLPSSIDPYTYLHGIKLSLGKYAKILCGGYTLYSESSQLIKGEEEDSITLIGLGENIKVFHRKVNGFLPLGESFTFTKVDEERRLILEIDNKPAIEIYRKYLGDKFEILKKNELFYLYPLGTKSNGNYKLVSIKEILGDESLFYLGNISPGEKGKIMVLKENLLLENTKKIVEEEKNKYSPRLVIIFDSMVRRKILKSKDNEEKYLIKEILGKETKVVGAYFDYHIGSREAFEELAIEEGNMYLTFWQ